MIKGSSHQDKSKAYKCAFIKQQSFQIYEAKCDRLERTNKSTSVFGDFHTPRPVINRISKWKVSKDILDLSNAINQADLLNIYRMFHFAPAEYRFFSRAHGAQTKINYSHKSKPTNWNHTERMFSDKNGIKVEINWKKDNLKNHHIFGNWMTHFSVTDVSKKL